MTRIDQPLRINGMQLRNRLYRAPVLEGAGRSERPAEVYRKHFVPNAASGVGLIIQGNTIITPEGRTSPGMNSVTDRAFMLQMRPMTEAVQAAGGRVVVQLGHGGLFALESWHKEFIDAATQPPSAVSRPPLWLRAAHRGHRVLSTEDVEAMVQRFGLVASWAQEAGYDGVQLAGANAKLLHQFLSRSYNRRTDAYGGDLFGRTRILREIRRAIANTCGPDFPVLLKYTALEIGPLGGGITAQDGLRIAQIAEEAGFDALTPAITSVLPDTSLCRGDWPGASFDNAKLRRNFEGAHHSRIGRALVHMGFRLSAWQYPYKAVWNQAVFGAVKEVVSIPVFAVGGIRTPEQAARILRNGEADMIGIGRPFYADPDLASWFLQEGRSESLRCENCNRCVLPQMLGMPGVCYNPASNQPRRRKQRAAK